MLQLFITWLRFQLSEHQRGQGLLEYALILILVAVACFIVLVALGNAINSGLYNNIISSF